MILGIGIDLVDIRRVEALLARFGERLKTRLFTAEEIAQSATRKDMAEAAFFAKRFAAKEAFAKALGSGMRDLRWHDVAVDNEANGKPCLRLSARARARMAGNAVAHLSLTDEYPYAQAMVVLEAR